MKAVQCFFRRHRYLYVATVTTLTLLVQVFGLPWDWGAG